MLIAGIDFETLGLDPNVDDITEIGLVLYDTEEKSPVQITGYLVATDKIVTEEITRLTGITNALLTKYGKPRTATLRGLLAAVKNVTYFLAHNGNNFDRPFLEAWCKRENLPMPTQPWIDSRVDLPAEAYEKGANLFVMAAAHGFLFDGHRAVNDVLATFKIMSKYDIDVVIQRALTPNVRARAVVSYEDRQLAKGAGFQWAPERKRWEISVKANELDALKARVTFPVVQIEEVA